MLTNNEDPLFTVFGLPVHVLVVHGAVVLLPLAVLGIIAMVFIPRLRRSLGWLVLVVMLVALGFAFLARFSGEALAERLGEPEPHVRLGNVLPWLALALTVVAIVWWAIAAAGERSARQQGSTASAPPPQPSGYDPMLDPEVTAVIAGEPLPEQPTKARTAAATFTGAVTVVLAMATLVWVVLTGHSGSQAVWAGTIEALETTPEPTPSAVATPSASPTPTTSPSPTTMSPSPAATARPTATAAASGAAVATFDMTDVRRHSSAIDCWVAIDGRVYNLTSWIRQHPGGPERIEQLCGTDASAQFAAQHADQGLPNRELGGFEIGRLG